MDWTQTFAIIGSLGVFIFWMFTKLHNDIKSLSIRLDRQHHRIDMLYQMFVDLLKDHK